MGEDLLTNERAQDLVSRLVERDRELECLATQYHGAPEAGRAALLLVNPDLQEELEYQAAQRSIVEARRSAERIEGQTFIW